VLRRYQRFLCDVDLEDGRTVTAHCTNTGTMATCWEVGDRVLLEPNDNPRRKLHFTWIACRRDGHWVGVETGVPNRVVAAAARRDLLPGLPGLTDVRTEVRYGEERSRIDVLANDETGRAVYIEVKNTTLRIETPNGAIVGFPDAMTTRGAKHLRELRRVVAAGHRAAVVFFVHREDVAVFAVARHIDPEYAAELDRARALGVEVLPVQARLQADEGTPGSWSLSWSLSGVLPCFDADQPGD
jgi:sugar fermentation stimulation protein A